MLIYKAVGKLSRDDVWKWTGRVMLTTGLIGCIMVAVPAAKKQHIHADYGAVLVFCFICNAE